MSPADLRQGHLEAEAVPIDCLKLTPSWPKVGSKSAPSWPQVGSKVAPMNFGNKRLIPESHCSCFWCFKPHFGGHLVPGRLRLCMFFGAVWFPDPFGYVCFLGSFDGGQGTLHDILCLLLGSIFGPKLALSWPKLAPSRPPAKVAQAPRFLVAPWVLEHGPL